MGAKARYVLRRHLFLLIGWFTLSLFVLVAALNVAGYTATAQALAVLMRILIVPMYLVWMVLTMALVALVGPHGLPGLLGVAFSGFSMVAGFAPYALADYLLDRWRNAASRKAADREIPDQF